MGNISGMIKTLALTVLFLVIWAAPSTAEDVRDVVVNAINHKDYDQAIKLLDKAVSDNAFDDELKKLAGMAYNARAWCRTSSDDYEGGLSDFKRARALETEKQADTYLGLGYASFRLKEYDDALYYLYDEVYLDQKDGRGHQIIGEIYYQRGKLTDAVKEWELAQILMPDDEVLKERLARARKELGVEESFTKKETYYFNIKYEGDEKRELGDLVLDTLSRAYGEVGADLDFFPKEPVTVILYTRKQFTDLTSAPSWSGGIFDGNIRIPIGGGNIDKEILAAVLYHEYTHAVIHMQAGNKVPTWLDEGIAQYEEHWVRGAKGDLGAAEFVPLSGLDGSFLAMSDPAKVKQAYAESLSAVEFYVDRFGKYNLGKLVRMLGQGMDLSDAIHETTGVSMQDFDALWSDSLRR